MLGFLLAEASFLSLFCIEGGSHVAYRTLSLLDAVGDAAQGVRPTNERPAERIKLHLVRTVTSTQNSGSLLEFCDHLDTPHHRDVLESSSTVLSSVSDPFVRSRDLPTWWRRHICTRRVPFRQRSVPRGSKLTSSSALPTPSSETTERQLSQYRQQAKEWPELTRGRDSGAGSRKRGGLDFKARKLTLALRKSIGTGGDGCLPKIPEQRTKTMSITQVRGSVTLLCSVPPQFLNHLTLFPSFRTNANQEQMRCEQEHLSRGAKIGWRSASIPQPVLYRYGLCRM